MDKIRRAYSHLDTWTQGLSRGGYATLIGVVSAIGALAVGVVFGEPNYAFALGISGMLAGLNYLSDPNRQAE
ncbi:hypothetical protein HWV07_15345 [Natronomonas salina]|uniref:hypothetical protein n=1 Tax=Natronomonas salina TaxID=1710540 RepID=UPI0015B533C7|nr:hypothetical protein [Natronomonas salina]QLD90335.1 hypothetical protein HWV07_15345 [Natronomonas salina]